MTDEQDLGLGLAPVADGKDPASGGRISTRYSGSPAPPATQWYKARRESGYLVRNKRDPGQYMAKQVWPVIYHAFATGLIQEVPDE